MLKNYILIAIAVLKRRKFFTFISLFGISFTITIITVFAAFFDHLFSATYPDVNRDRELYATSIVMTSEKKQNTYEGGMSAQFFTQYVSKMQSHVTLAIQTENSATYSYINNKKLLINVKYTNGAFWEVFQFRFTEGKPYTQQQVLNGDKVIVISENTKQQYFGDEQQVVGKYIETDNVQYRVAGVVKNVPEGLEYHYADAYLPYSHSKKGSSASFTFDGPFIGTILVDKKEDMPRVQEEYQQLVSRLPIDRKLFDTAYSFAGPYFSTFTRSFVQSNSGETGINKFLTIVGTILLVLLLLPTLNLININITRISERYSEIGIRKAFGASSATLTVQFLVENLLLTLLGGIFGILLSLIVIQVLNSSNIVEDLHLTMNFNVVLYSLAVCLFFGFISGVYPAWRMSRLQISQALKA